MSHASLILLSGSATPSQLQSALGHAGDGERLLILPPHLQHLAGSEPALNLNLKHSHLRGQLVDRAIAALRPGAIVADLTSLEAITPNLDRHPQLKTAIIITDGSERKKCLRRQAAFFQVSKTVAASK